MKQNELMIGDWVQDKNDKLIFQIKTHWAIYNAKEFDPVPITKEILNKNGFEIDKYSIRCLKGGCWLEYYHHEHRLRLMQNDIEEHSRATKLVFQCPVWYVHELQHALRLCKIDKEIKL